MGLRICAVPFILREFLDVAADIPDFFFNVVLAARDMTAGVVDDRLAFGAETGEDQRRARRERASRHTARYRARRVGPTVDEGYSKYKKAENKLHTHLRLLLF